ncbi:MAG: universal stress protein [Haloarculaceae archaeon]
MYRVLVTVDDDRQRADELIDSIERLAEEVPELSVTLLHVIRETDVPSQVAIHQPVEDYGEELDESRVPVAVQEAAARLEDVDFDCEVRIEHGDPAPVIIERANEGGYDTIYIGGRRNSPVGKVLFGSVVQGVLLNTDVPVTVVGQRE